MRNNKKAIIMKIQFNFKGCGRRKKKKKKQEKKKPN